MKSTKFLVALLYGTCILGATYTVPVPEELKEDARWDEVTAAGLVDDKKIAVTYNLPTDLVGTKLEELHFEGVKEPNNDFVTVKGNKVHGVCMQSAQKTLTCMLKYPRHIVDVPTRDASLKEHFVGNELDIRTRVARVFGAEPTGVLTVPFETVH